MRTARLLTRAILAATVLAGCATGHPRDTLSPVSDSGVVSAWFYHLLLALGIVIFTVVCGALVIALVRYRRKPGDDTLPEQSFGNIKLEVAWTIVPTLIVVGITIPTLGGIFELAQRPDPNQRIIEVEVTGKQFWWEFDYKNEGIQTANELHVEVGTQVLLHMTSADVIHAWWVPRIAGKRDATPGRTFPLAFRPSQVGEFTGQCAELCGASHALMGTKIIVHPPAGENSYLAWVADMQAPAHKPQTADEQAGQKAFMDLGCVACHSVQGVAELSPGARSRTSGPNLTHVGSRTTIAALRLKNTPENMASWIQDPHRYKQGVQMTTCPAGDGPEAVAARARDPNCIRVTAEQARQMAAYLTSLK